MGGNFGGSDGWEFILYSRTCILASRVCLIVEIMFISSSSGREIPVDGGWGRMGRRC